MPELFYQNEIRKDDRYRMAFMTADILREWLADGWQRHEWYPHTAMYLVRQDDGSCW